MTISFNASLPSLSFGARSGRDGRTPRRSSHYTTQGLDWAAAKEHDLLQRPLGFTPTAHYDLPEGAISGTMLIAYLKVTYPEQVEISESRDGAQSRIAVRNGKIRVFSSIDRHRLGHEVKVNDDAVKKTARALGLSPSELKAAVLEYHDDLPC